MVYAAPPLRARLLLFLAAANPCRAARGGLVGGDGIPWIIDQNKNPWRVDKRPTELTSGTPLDPGNARSGIMEALETGCGSLYGIGGGADIARRAS